MSFPPAIDALHNYQQYIRKQEGKIDQSRLNYYVNKSRPPPYDSTEDDVSRLLLSSIHKAFLDIRSHATARNSSRFLLYAHPMLLMTIYIKESPIHSSRYAMALIVMCSMNPATKISAYLECALIATNDIPLYLKKDYPGLVDLWQKQNELFQSKKAPWGLFYFRLLALAPNFAEDGSRDMNNALRVVYNECQYGKRNTADLFQFYWQIYRLLKNEKKDSPEWRHYKNMEQFLVLFTQQYTELNSQSQFNLILETAAVVRHIAEQNADGREIDAESLLYMQQLDWDILFFESDPCMIEPNASYLTDEFRINYMTLLINEMSKQSDEEACEKYLSNIVFPEDEDKELNLNERRWECVAKLNKFKIVPNKLSPKQIWRQFVVGL